MAAKKNKKGNIFKNIELPPKTVKGLERLAKSERMTVKPYMEKVLINHAKIESSLIGVN